MLKQLRIATLMLVVMTALTGIAYPLAMTGLAQVIFPKQANGSLLTRNGQVVGSSLIGQSFVNPKTGAVIPGYFRGRPSAAGSGYDAADSGGSNLGPTNAALVARMTKDIAQIRKENNLPATAQIPVDLVTASASGLDPDISPASAALQLPRVARQRGLSEAQVQQLVKANTSGRTLGFLGEPRVNVLTLNLALDKLKPMPKPAP